MSYIVAYVSFDAGDKEYPVACYRTDVQRGDEVIVRMGDLRVAAAVVTTIVYMDWDCQGRILCKASEGSLADGVLSINKGTPTRVGMVAPDQLIAALSQRGWIRQRFRNIYRAVFVLNNDHQTARIWVRNHGVDLQLLAQKQPLPSPNSLLNGSVAEGRFVRHYLASTTFNLFDGIMRFAAAFESSAGDYDRFFVSVGTKDRRSAELQEASQLRKLEEAQRRSEDSWARDMCDASGGGDSAYLGDGMYVSRGGRIYETD